MLTLFHDPTDPASAVCVARYGRLASEGLAITFEGFDAVGVDVELPVEVGVLAMIDWLEDEAENEGLTLSRPRTRPPTALAHVVLHHAEQTDRAHAFRTALYGAYWADGADIADPTVLVEVSAASGLDRGTVTDVLGDRVELASRRRQMASHRRVGVGGVPVVLASRTLIPALRTEAEIRDLAAAV